MKSHCLESKDTARDTRGVTSTGISQEKPASAHPRSSELECSTAQAAAPRTSTVLSDVEGCRQSTGAHWVRGGVPKLAHQAWGTSVLGRAGAGATRDCTAAASGPRSLFGCKATRVGAGTLGTQQKPNDLKPTGNLWRKLTAWSSFSPAIVTQRYGSAGLFQQTSKPSASTSEFGHVAGGLQAQSTMWGCVSTPGE